MLIQGDLFDVLQTLNAESIDACVTDPPYGIGFMGKEWDTFLPENIQAAAAMKQRKNPEQIANLKNVYGRRRSPAKSPSQIEYDRTPSGQVGFQMWCERWAREVFRVLKPGAYIVVCGAPRSFHRMTCGLEDAGFEIRDCFLWLYSQGFPKSLNLGDGRGTALKPSWEPCVLGRKPFKGSVASILNRFGTGALNIDACRLDLANDEPNRRDTPSRAEENGIFGVTGHDGTLQQGRWPANVLLDEEAAALLDAQTGELVSGGFPETRNVDKFLSIYGVFKGGEVNPDGRGANSGGASRFYYVAKPSREERDYGCEGLPARSGGETCEERAEGSAGLNSPRAGAGRTGGSRNIHPTVKPIELMRWLVRLVTPPGGTVLDPFTGSGTTGMACRYEFREFVGIEREAEYIAIAERRIAAVAPLFGAAGLLRMQRITGMDSAGSPCWDDVRNDPAR